MNDPDQLGRIESKLDTISGQLADNRVQSENHRMRLGALEQFRDSADQRIEEATERAVRRVLSADPPSDRRRRSSSKGDAGDTDSGAVIRIPTRSLGKLLRYAGVGLGLAASSALTTWYALRAPPAPTADLTPHAVPSTSPASQAKG